MLGLSLLCPLKVPWGQERKAGEKPKAPACSFRVGHAVQEQSQSQGEISTFSSVISESQVAHSACAPHTHESTVAHSKTRHGLGHPGIHICIFPAFAVASPKNSGQGGIGEHYQGLGSHPWYDNNPRKSSDPSWVHHSVDVPMLEMLASLPSLKSWGEQPPGRRFAKTNRGSTSPHRRHSGSWFPPQ